MPIGRNEASVVQVSSERAISRKHAELVASSRGVFIEDLGSRVGTWIADHKLPAHEPRRVEGMVEVRIAYHRLKLVVHDKDASVDVIPWPAPPPTPPPGEFDGEPTRDERFDTAALSAPEHSATTFDPDIAPPPVPYGRSQVGAEMVAEPLSMNDQLPGGVGALSDQKSADLFQREPRWAYPMLLAGSALFAVVIGSVFVFVFGDYVIRSKIGAIGISLVAIAHMTWARQHKRKRS